MFSPARPKKQEEYVTFSLTSPQRKTLQNLLTISNFIAPSTTQNTQTSSYYPRNNNFQRPPTPMKSNSKKKKKNKNKNKNKNNNNFQYSYPNTNNIQYFPQQQRQRRSPYQSPKKSPRKFNSDFNNSNGFNVRPNAFNLRQSVQQHSRKSSPNPKSQIEQVESPPLTWDLSNPLIASLLVTAMSQTQKLFQDNVKVEEPSNSGPQTPRFQYSSKLSSRGSSFSPRRKSSARKSPGRQRKNVSWAENLENTYEVEKHDWNDYEEEEMNTNFMLYNDGLENKWPIRLGSLDINGRTSIGKQNYSTSQQNSGYNGDYPSPVYSNNFEDTRPALRGILKTKRPEESFKENFVPKGSPGKGLLGKRQILQLNEGDWICPNPQCGNVNFKRRENCNRCGIIRPGNFKKGPSFKKGDWNCGDCRNYNFAKRSNCNKCMSDRPVESYEKYRPGKNSKIKKQLEEGEIDPNENNNRESWEDQLTFSW